MKVCTPNIPCESISGIAKHHAFVNPRNSIDSDMFNYKVTTSYKIEIVLNSLTLIGDQQNKFKSLEEDFSFHCCIAFNEDAKRKHFCRFPEKGYLVNRDKKNQIIFNVSVFEGLISEIDQMKISFIYLKKNSFTSDIELPVYEQEFPSSPLNWDGKYISNKENFYNNEELEVFWELAYTVSIDKI